MSSSNLIDLMTLTWNLPLNFDVAFCNWLDKFLPPTRITKRCWVPKAKEVVDKVKADNKRGKRAQEKVPSPKVTPKPIPSSNRYAVLNSIEAKECKFSGLRNHNSPKMKFSTVTVQEVIEEALKCSTKTVVKA